MVQIHAVEPRVVVLLKNKRSEINEPEATLPENCVANCRSARGYEEFGSGGCPKDYPIEKRAFCEEKYQNSRSCSTQPAENKIPRRTVRSGEQSVLTWIDCILLTEPETTPNFENNFLSVVLIEGRGGLLFMNGPLHPPGLRACSCV